MQGREDIENHSQTRDLEQRQIKLESRQDQTERELRTLVSTVTRMAETQEAYAKTQTERHKELLEYQGRSDDKIDDLRKDLFSRSKPAYNLMLSVVVVLGALITLYVNPVAQKAASNGEALNTYEFNDRQDYRELSERISTTERDTALALQGISSLHTRTEHIEGEIVTLAQHESEIKDIRVWIADLEKDQEQDESNLTELRSHVSKSQGTIELLREQVQAIDDSGSRIWNKSQKSAP